jgi:hypothetical protein
MDPKSTLSFHESLNAGSYQSQIDGIYKLICYPLKIHNSVTIQWAWNKDASAHYFIL